MKGKYVKVVSYNLELSEVEFNSLLGSLAISNTDELISYSVKNRIKILPDDELNKLCDELIKLKNKVDT